MVERAAPLLKHLFPAPALAAPNLGVDHVPDVRRRKKTSTLLRQKRANKMGERAQHIQKIRAMMSRDRARMHRFEVVGLALAAAYGTRVWGIAPGEFRKARVCAMASAPPTAQASMSAKFLFHGDPLVAPSVVVVLGFFE